VTEESAYYVAIAVAFFGFVALAFLLLFPIYRFMRKEEQRSEAWTPPALAERQRRAIEQSERAAASGDGAGSEGGAGGPGEPPALERGP
jgi:hypothetical protein